MNTEITVQIKGNAEAILECAYKSLLFLDDSKYNSPYNYINNNLLVASIALKRKGIINDKFVCIIQVKRLAQDICELIFTLDRDDISSTPSRATNIMLMSEFIRVFDENYFKSVF